MNNEITETLARIGVKVSPGKDDSGRVIMINMRAEEAESINKELLEALEEIASGVFCDLKSVEEYAQRIINKLENK